MEYGPPTNIENFGPKESVSHFGSTLNDYTTVSTTVPSTVIPTSIPVPSVNLSADFANFPERYGHNYIAPISSQSQPSMSMAILGSESATAGAVYHDPSTGPVLPVTGDGWVLLPPHRTAAPPKLRERPIGCKTIFVGGLPKVLADNQERAESVLKALFVRFNEVREIRVNQRQFAHVRFFAEEAAVTAVAFSGCRLYMDGQDDKMHANRLHVDYACNREDSREWEAHIRALERERRLQERMNPSSPTPVTPFSDAEVSVVTEKIKNSESFEKASAVLHTWLDRGELTRRNANQFYSLIQCANSHIRHLVSEKKTYQDELESAKFIHAQKMSVIIRQLGQIQNILQAASKQKCWDHFSKPQRKNLETWRKQCEELVVREQNQHLESRQEDEMDFSDSDMESSDHLSASAATQRAVDEDSEDRCSGQFVPVTSALSSSLVEKQLSAENARLREQVVALQNQLINMVTSQPDGDSAVEPPNSKRQRTSFSSDEVGGNSPAMAEKSPVGGTEAELQSLKQVLHGTQQSLLGMQKQLAAELKTRTELESRLSEMEKYPTHDRVHEESPSIDKSFTFTPCELKTLGLVCTFLSIHPSGAELKSITTFLHEANHDIPDDSIEGFLRRVSTLFSVSSGNRWTFCAHRSSCPEESMQSEGIESCQTETQPSEPEPVEVFCQDRT